MRRLLLPSTAGALVLGLLATPTASAQQSVNLYLGGFTPTSFDARGNDDVLFQDSMFLSTLNRSNGIDIGQFNNVTVGGEWLVGLGRTFEAGLGLGFYQKTVPTVYTNFTNPDGSDISQNLKLRVVPFTATFRVLPFGENEPIQPYIGAGVAVYAWRYSETGQFLDNQNNIFVGNFVGSGGAVGPVVMGGVRIPARPVGIGGEIRWQSGEATLPSSQGFAGPKINLGGFSYLVLFNVKF